jgi:hypothetical protein
LILLREIFDWIEVWAHFIPIAVLFSHPKQPSYFKPIIIYVWLGLIINIIGDVGWKMKDYYPEFYETYHLPWLKDNNYVYNILSMLRFICFSSFFIRLNQPFHQKLKKIIPFFAVAFVIINFAFFEYFFQTDTISSNLFSVETGLLLVYCLLYFLYRMQISETQNLKWTADFWVVLGLSFYVVLNFFYFLFYKKLTDSNHGQLLTDLWDYHNITYCILLIFIARAFYVSRHH